MYDLIWFLLPVAALGGWVTARRSASKPQSGRPDTILSHVYLKGLNHLLDEQPDKAIEVFIRMLEVTADTFETHLALGSLCRRRGEVDRAIRIHQNLVARETISREQRDEALVELGQDYMQAGLLDRAEGIFQEMLRCGTNLSCVRPRLLDIYQQEKEWARAVGIAEGMTEVRARPARSVIAQFYCEMAEAARHQGDPPGARGFLEQALSRDRGCARASILLGDMEREAGDPAAAVLAYREVETQDIDLLPEVLEPMYACHRELGSVAEMIDYLQGVIRRYPGISPVLVLADMLAREQGHAAAAGFIAGQLMGRPSLRGSAKYADLMLSCPTDPPAEILVILKGLVDQLLHSKPVYRCSECGFAGKTLHWQCPACKNWDVVRPIHGIEGD